MSVSVCCLDCSHSYRLNFGDWIGITDTSECCTGLCVGVHYRWKTWPSRPWGVSLLQPTDLGFVVLIEDMGKGYLGGVDVERC